MGGLPLRTPTHRRNGGPSHRRLPNAPHAHPRPPKRAFLPRGCPQGMYAVSAPLSEGCTPGGGRLHTCYSPVRRSPAGRASASPAAPRLACVKPAASVHPEPGSNSPLFMFPSCDESIELSVPAFRCCLGLPQNQPPKGTARKPRCFLCPVASLSMSLGIPVNPGRPLRLAPFPFCECKVTTFPRNTQTFLELFPNFFVEAQSKRCQTHI